MGKKQYDRIVNYIVENQNKFYRLAFSYVRNQDDALDVVQNAICKALDHYTALRNIEAVKTWFYRIVVNESILFLKNQKKEYLAGEENYADGPYIEKKYEPMDELFDQIDQLDEEVQKIIKLRFFEELSLREIADVVQMNLNTVKAKLYRGLKLLKQNIQEVDL